MTKIFNENDKIKAFCPTCKSIVTVTFIYRPYLTEKKDEIPNVLQGFCDSCHERLLLPPQSTPKIAPYYKKQSEFVDYMVPEVINDVLLSIGYHSRLETPDAFKSMLRYYLSKSNRISWIKKAKVTNLGPARSRLSFKLDEPTHSKLKQVASKIELSKNQFIMRMIWDAKDRLLINGTEAKEFTTETKLLRVPENF